MLTLDGLVALEEFVLDLANDPPSFILENHDPSVIILRRTDRHYYLIDEVDAGRLEALRKIIPTIIEERRKRETRVNL
jgi:hypothetical protein